MFLTTNELGLSDFLSAMQFIPPAGKTVEYFIAPTQVAGDTPGFEKSNDEPITPSDSIVYTRKDPATKISQADTPEDYSANTAMKIENSGPKVPVVPQTTPIEALDCPFVDVLSDDALGTDILLKENFGPFKKNTLFHCK